MNTNNTSIRYGLPSSLSISQEMYVDQVKHMIMESLERDPTIILHTDEEILYKYDKSVVALHDDLLIGNLSMYPTKMSPLDCVICPTYGDVSIGELGSVIVDLGYRKQGIGKKLVEHSLGLLSTRYDAVVSATINDYMTAIFDESGFERVPFPKEYFEEGRQYLGPKLPGGVVEFKKKAKCFMLFNKDIQQIILDILVGKM